MKKAAYSGFPVLILVFFVIGCQMGEDPDTWTDLTSLDQINGTCNSSYSQTYTIREIIEAQGDDWNDGLAARFGDMKATVSIDLTITFNGNAATQTVTMQVAQVFSGGRIDNEWPNIKKGYSEPVIVNDEHHSVSMAREATHPLAISDLAGTQINQHGTKLKIPPETQRGLIRKFWDLLFANPV
ncbi:MAG: hypothetical protein LBF95_06275 [Treponema sp.]|jgi:hypothetical protein|nr:hypothetical protein [Treponema sp.]